jgi:putative oxidoreductase
MAWNRVKRYLRGEHETTGVQTYLPFVGRVLIALIFLWSGLGKIMDPLGTIGFIASVGLPLPQLGYALALLAEIGGGILLVIGFQTRIVAIVLALSTLVTALAFHNAFGLACSVPASGGLDRG